MTRQQKLVERLASIEHERWSDWQKYVHSKLYEIDDNRVSYNNKLKILPTELYQRWERQIATPFCHLSREEQRSDLKEVTRYFPHFVAHVEGLVSGYMKALDGIELPEDVWKQIADVNREYLLENIPVSTS